MSLLINVTAWSAQLWPKKLCLKVYFQYLHNLQIVQLLYWPISLHQLHVCFNLLCLFPPPGNFSFSFLLWKWKNNIIFIYLYLFNLYLFGDASCMLLNLIHWHPVIHLACYLFQPTDIWLGLSSQVIFKECNPPPPPSDPSSLKWMLKL